MKKVISALFLGLFAISVGFSQELLLSEGQLKLGMSGDCHTTAISYSMEGQLNMTTGAFQLLVPMATFQASIRQQIKAAGKEACYSVGKYPMSTLEGHLLEPEHWAGKADGSYPVEMEGTWFIDGLKITLSEKAMMHVENGRVRLSFETEKTVDGLTVSLAGEVGFLGL